MTTAFRILGLAPSVPPDGITAQTPQTTISALMQFFRNVRDVVNGAMTGDMNATLDVTLAANAASTVVNDPRIGGSSFIGTSMPLTAHAAAEKAAGGMYVSSRGNQTATITHANNAQADRSFRLAIIG